MLSDCDTRVKPLGLCPARSRAHCEWTDKHIINKSTRSFSLQHPHLIAELLASGAICDPLCWLLQADMALQAQLWNPGWQGGHGARPSPAHPTVLESAPWGGPRLSQASVPHPLQLGLSRLGEGRNEEEALPGIYVSQGKGAAAAVGGAMVSTCWLAMGCVCLLPASRARGNASPCAPRLDIAMQAPGAVCLKSFR